MAYLVENGIWRGVFAVPTEIVDTHLKLAGETQLKTLLALLRWNGGLEAQALAKECGKPLADVLDALEYWRERGVLAREGESKPALAYEEVPAPVPAAPPEPPAPQKTTEATAEGQRITTISSQRRRLDRLEIAELCEKDENVAALLQESQAALGKTLNAVDTDTIVSLYSYYGLAPDLILMLLHYCVGNGKSNLRYIEKTAASWIESGITTHEKAEAEICRRARASETENRVKRAFGIFDRALVASEKNYIRVWCDEWKLDDSLISLAYERCVELKAKLSFPYINGILQNWRQKNIQTPQEAQREIHDDSRKPAASALRKKPEQPASYDLAELEKLVDSGPY